MSSIQMSPSHPSPQLPSTTSSLSSSPTPYTKLNPHASSATTTTAPPSLTTTTNAPSPSHSHSHSLVKYDNPVLISKTEPKGPSKAALGTHAIHEPTPMMMNLIKPHSPTGKSKLPPMEEKRSKSPTQTDDILNSILPPREWEENGQLWVQKVSSTPATRLDVVNLQEQLDAMLQRRQARETGICPVRRELYSQCFDELIRQVTISCQERGLLLLRIRDEIRMSIAAYQTLYESSVAFGMRKALMAEWGKSEMEFKIKELEKDKMNLELQVAEYKAKCEAIEKREAERRAMDERKHAEEISFMKKTNLQLKTQLEGILAPQKK